jgi:uncharacterized protein (UPF0548 family)
MRSQPRFCVARNQKAKMLSLQKPSAEAIRCLLGRQAKCDLTYPAVGATVTTLPPDCVMGHTRINFEEGREIFQTANAALRRWEQCHPGWLAASPTETPIQTGQVVAVLARAIGHWWLKPSNLSHRCHKCPRVRDVALCN